MQQEFIYVSSVEGHLVTRFPSLQAPVAQYVGARRIAGKEHRGKKIEWNPDEVVAIPVQEWTRYRREYRSAVSDGALKLRKKEDHDKWLSKREEDSKKVAEEIKKVEGEAAKADNESSNAAPPSSPAPSTGSEEGGNENDEQGNSTDEQSSDEEPDNQPQNERSSSRSKRDKKRASQGEK